MTKKDYIVIASTLQKSAGKSLLSKEENDLYAEIVTNFINVLSEENERFDAVRFAEACTELSYAQINK